MAPVILTRWRLGSSQSPVTAVAVYVCVFLFFLSSGNLRSAGTQEELPLKGFSPEDKLGNLLLSLVIPFSTGEKQDRAGGGVMEGRQKQKGGCGEESQESAVISHETKAHSAQLWLQFHTLSRLRDSARTAIAARRPFAMRRRPAAALSWLCLRSITPPPPHFCLILAAWLGGALSGSCLTGAHDYGSPPRVRGEATSPTQHLLFVSLIIELNE